MSSIALTPPIVTTDDFRILVDQHAATSVLKGFLKAHPEVRIRGSFNTSPDNIRPPIEIPMPFSGGLKVNYRLELTDAAFDFSPKDENIINSRRPSKKKRLQNPFTLPNDHVALYTCIVFDMAGDPVTLWAERIEINTWIKCQILEPDIEGYIGFQLLDIQVYIDDIANSSFLSIINNILRDYLLQSVERLRFRFNGVVEGGVFSAALTDWSIHDDALDLMGKL